MMTIETSQADVQSLADYTAPMPRGPEEHDAGSSEVARTDPDVVPHRASRTVYLSGLFGVFETSPVASPPSPR